MLIRWKNKDKDKEKCEKSSNQKQSSTSKKKRKFGREGGNFVFVCCSNKLIENSILITRNLNQQNVQILIIDYDYV